MRGLKTGISGFFRVLAALMLLFAAAGCNDSSGDGETSLGYGGSIPKGDYVTAEINGSQITIKNYQDNVMDTTLGFGGLPAGVPDIGTSIIHVTDADVDGNYYVMALVEDRVLAMHKMDSELTPISTELPVYLFERSLLTADDLKGKSFNFMELFAGSEGELSVEVGIVGFDTDDSGRLYGAAYDSEEDAVYSITDEDGIENSGDEFSLDLTESQNDGSLVLWEGPAGFWPEATTLTGSASGPIVLDHGPLAGGGAGFAFPQVSGETTADAFWADVTGHYFMIAHYDDGEQTQTEYLRCYAAQENPGQWAGMLYLTFSLDIDPYENRDSLGVASMAMIPLSQDETAISEIEAAAGFSSAQSGAVQNATQGRGLFQGAGEASDFTVAFDPNGDYILAVKSGGAFEGFDWVTGFGLGIRDRNWQEAEQVSR